MLTYSGDIEMEQAKNIEKMQKRLREWVKI